MSTAPPRAATRLASLMLLTSFCSALIYPVLPHAVLAWGGTAYDGGTVVSAYSLASMASAPVLGRVSDRVGRQPVLLASYLCSALAYLGLAGADGIGAAIAWRVAGGLAAGSLSVLQASVLDASGAARSAGLARLSSFAALGYMLGPACAALFGSGSGLAGVAMVAAAISAGQLLLGGLLIPTRPDDVRQGSASPPAPPASPAERPLLLASIFVIALVQAGIFAMAGYYAAARLGWDERALGLLLVEGALLVAGAQFLAVPRLIALAGPRRGAEAACAAGLVASLWLWLVPPGDLAMYLACPILFCATSAVQTCLLTSWAEDGQGGRGEKMGASAMLVAAGQVVGPTLFGAVMTGLGADLLFTGAAAAFLLVLAGRTIAWAPVAS